MTRIRSALRSAVAGAIVLLAVLAMSAPAGAITGGQEDSSNTFSNVGMVVFYQPDGRFRCSGTLIAPQVFLTAAHCTFQDIGKVAVTFDWEISRTEPESEVNIPRAADDAGPDDAISAIGFTTADISAPEYVGEPTWVLGTPRTHPEYSDFTDIKNWNDTGVVILDAPAALPTTPLAPENYLDDFEQPIFNHTEFLVIGYGTEVRQEGPPHNNPIPQRQPIVRRSTMEIGQKLTPQVFQMQGNEHDPRAGGGTCFGDSGGPAILDGFVVGDTSYGLTLNCRYIGGYQRVDIPLVRNWLLDCMADLVCDTKAA
jgi:secreted trypsin-like serine protease